jgi:hypothetical protein
MQNASRTWGIAGLLAFEAIIAARTFGASSLTFSLMYAIGAIALAFALFLPGARWPFGVVAAVSLYRAYLQTVGGQTPLGVYPTYLVPLGFAWFALLPRTMPAAAIACIAVARTWFVVWYALPGNWIVVAANVVGAAGAWVWAASAMREPVPDDAPAPTS